MKTFVKTINISKNKSIEIQLDLFLEKDWNLFDFQIRHSLKGDHCGFVIKSSLYRLYDFHFQVYDHRHWDWEKDEHEN